MSDAIGSSYPPPHSAGDAGRVYFGDREVGSGTASAPPNHAVWLGDPLKYLSPPALTPPPDFWDRVAREAARLMVERQAAQALGPSVADAR
ncbi:hypothetical protein SAMN02745194_03078 [Roseomonas rosea]|uniref:Uncharacterized protein n=1 Tax=Muricoccus roseus TaxID=198092 RepID=A0A1M6L810_9PROT|nr:hypothetical protein [Roseomonas rosea]SHJ67320.1 hypothetical protein SAMN02745194_03078 [Roseomonas rosea]